MKPILTKTLLFGSNSFDANASINVMFFNYLIY